MTTWLYFATLSRASERDTYDLARNGYLWRSVYNSAGLSIANVKKVCAGDQIVLLYESVAVGVFEVLRPEKFGIPGFSAAAVFPDEMITYLNSIGYLPDKKIGRHTGFFVDAGGDEFTSALLGKSFVQRGRNAIPRLDDCFAAEASDRGSQVDSASLPLGLFAERVNFKQKPSSIAVPPKGTQFLGVDIGYAGKKESLGYCILEMGDEGLQPLMQRGNVRGASLNNIDAFESTTLPAIFNAQLASICHNCARWSMTKDNLNDAGFIDLKNTSFCKARSFRRGQGRKPTKVELEKLTEATLRIRRVCERAGYHYESFDGIEVGKGGIVVEAFPKAFLAFLFDPASIDDNLNRYGTERFAADWSMARWLIEGSHDNFKGVITNLHLELSSLGLPVSKDARVWQTSWRTKTRLRPTCCPWRSPWLLRDRIRSRSPCMAASCFRHHGFGTRVGETGWLGPMREAN